MKISVIIPAYKAEATIHRALASILQQTMMPAEVIVVDDGSPTPLSNVEEQYGHPVKLYRKKNGGAASARNFGIDRAQGDFIAFLDADDYWEPEKLERQLALHLKYPEIGFSFGSYWKQKSPIEKNPEKTLYDVSRFYPVAQPLTLIASDAFRAATNAWTGTVMVSRSLLGTSRFPEQLRTAEDRDLWFRLIKGGITAYFNEPLATLVLEPGSLSRAQVSADYQNFISVIDANSAELGAKATKDWKARTYRAWAGTLLSEKCFSEALKPAVMRLRYQPFSIQSYYIIGAIAVRGLIGSLRS